jgi:hypothetical protein
MRDSNHDHLIWPIEEVEDVVSFFFDVGTSSLFFVVGSALAFRRCTRCAHVSTGGVGLLDCDMLND